MLHHNNISKRLRECYPNSSKPLLHRLGRKWLNNDVAHNAITINEIRGRNRCHPIRLIDRATAIKKQGIGHMKGCPELRDIIFRVSLVDPQQGKMLLRSILLVHALKIWHLCLTWHARLRPEIEQHRMPMQAMQINISTSTIVNGQR